MRKTRKLADEAEQARDTAHTELILPLRKMRSGDFLTPAIAEEIRRKQYRE